MKGISYPKLHALVSGGKDSLSTAQVLHDAGKLAGCVALETGLSTPDWKEFVMKTCDERGWKLEFYQTDYRYEQFVLKYGFPGPSKHSWIMRYLKGRCIRGFRKAHPDGILASGVRTGESDKRAGSTKPVGAWEGAPILAPIYDWTTDETWAYFRENGFERAPAYSTLQISGDCLCGAYARQDELEAVNFHYPAIGTYFRQLGEEIKLKHPKRCEWGWAWKQPIKPKKKNEAMVCVECGGLPDPEQLPLLPELEIAA